MADVKTVKSQFSIAGLVAPLGLALSVIAGGGVYAVLHRADLRMESPDSSVTLTIAIVVIVLAAIVIFLLVKYVNRVTVNQDGIFYTNVITRREKHYRFSEFKGYVISAQQSKGSVYQVLYPVLRRGGFTGGISSAYYVNYEELKAALPLKDLKGKE